MADAFVKIAYKYRDFYGESGLIFVHYVTPYFWVFPLIASILLIMSFKRLNLFGPTQKCLVTVMVIDVFFLLLVGLKDLIFNALNWNHGFIEYKVCMFMLIFVRIQTVIHGTSLWVKSLMLIHKVLMFISPFKFRQLNLKFILLLFLFVHLLIVILFCTILIKTPISRFPTVQEYLPGMPLQIIDACVTVNEEEFFVGIFYSLINWISFFSQIVYFTTLPICIQFVCTILLIFMVRKEINRLSHLRSTSRALKNLNYLILIKVHIYLGISFIIQEAPIYVAFILTNVSWGEKNMQTTNSIILIYMYQTFAIGKPIDLLIYASLSQKVKSELMNIICCKRQRNNNKR